MLGLLFSDIGGQPAVDDGNILLESFHDVIADLVKLGDGKGDDGVTRLKVFKDK